MILVAAAAIRLQGIAWERLHPDERVIASWIDRTDKHWSAPEVVYPNGFFMLIRPFRRAVLGAVALADHWAYWTRQAVRLEPARVDSLLLARFFNVLLALLTCVLVYLTGRRITGSRGAGLFAALLLAFHQYHVEHSHYAETDIAMVFALSAALWLWTVFADRGTFPVFAAASAAAGFAAGTKFPLLFLVLLPLPGAVVLARRAPADRLRRGLIAAGAGILFFALGFTIANPGVIEPGEFLAGLRHESARVYSETLGLLGPAADDPSARFLMKGRGLLLAAGSLGAPWAALAAVGFVLGFTRPFRKHWIVLALVPILYLAYYLGAAPWVRSQEFLNFLPSLAVLASIPILVILRRSAGVSYRTPVRLAVLAVALAAVIVDARRGLAVADGFGWSDTRVLARGWVKKHAPLDETVAFETYTDPIHQGTFRDVVGILKAERPGADTGLSYALERGCSYIFRNAVMTGRGTLDPRTGRRFAEYEAAWKEFRNRAVLLRIWAPLLRPLATFCNPELQLYSLQPHREELRIDVPFVPPLDLHPFNRTTYFPVGSRLGSTPGIEITRCPVTCAVAGPGVLDRPVFAVIQTGERSAEVILRGFGRKRELALAPYDLRIVPLRRRTIAPPWRRFERVTVRARPIENIVRIPCFFRIVFRPVEAARLCADSGYPRRALEFLEQYGSGRPEEDLLQYRLLTRLGEWSKAGRLRSRIVDAVRSIETALELDPASVRLSGVNALEFDRFARLRLGNVSVRIDPLPVSSGGTGGSARVDLPLRLDHGGFRLSGTIRVRAAGTAPEPGEGSLTIRDDRGNAVAVVPVPGTKGAVRSVPMEIVLSTDIDRRPRLDFSADRPVQVDLRDLELGWNSREILETCRRSARIALARHCVHDGDFEGALQWLEDLGEPGTGAGEIAEIRLRSLLALGADSRKIRRASESLRRAAPSHPLLAVEGRGAEEAFPNLGHPVVFEPLVRLDAVRWEGSPARLLLGFTILRDETPPLRIVLEERRRWRRRTIAAAPLHPGGFRSRGERFVVRFDPSEGGVNPLDPARLSIRVESAVPWLPGSLRIAETGRDRLPLGEFTTPASNRR